MIEESYHATVLEVIQELSVTCDNGTQTYCLQMTLIICVIRGNFSMCVLFFHWRVTNHSGLDGFNSSKAWLIRPWHPFQLVIAGNVSLKNCRGHLQDNWLDLDDLIKKSSLLEGLSCLIKYCGSKSRHTELRLSLTICDASTSCEFVQMQFQSPDLPSALSPTYCDCGVDIETMHVLEMI